MWNRTYQQQGDGSDIPLYASPVGLETEQAAGRATVEEAVDHLRTVADLLDSISIIPPSKLTRQAADELARGYLFTDAAARDFARLLAAPASQAPAPSVPLSEPSARLLRAAETVLLYTENEGESAPDDRVEVGEAWRELEAAAAALRAAAVPPEKQQAGENDRGLYFYADFEDSYGARVVVQDSSAAFEPHAWLRVDGGGISGNRGSAHLTSEQARRVRTALNDFLTRRGSRTPNSTREGE
jgi:hypothetical protein